MRSPEETLPSTPHLGLYAEETGPNGGKDWETFPRRLLTWPSSAPRSTWTELWGAEVKAELQEFKADLP